MQQCTKDYGMVFFFPVFVHVFIIHFYYQFLTYLILMDKLLNMNIETIRAKIREGNFSIIDHALIESFKDGITFDDIL